MWHTAKTVSPSLPAFLSVVVGSFSAAAALDLVFVCSSAY